MCSWTLRVPFNLPGVPRVGRLQEEIGSLAGLRQTTREPISGSGGRHRNDWFVDNLLSMTRIAIRLEDETWTIALRVVPPAWWDNRTDDSPPQHTPLSHDSATW